VLSWNSRDISSKSWSREGSKLLNCSGAAMLGFPHDNVDSVLVLVSLIGCVEFCVGVLETVYASRVVKCDFCANLSLLMTMLRSLGINKSHLDSAQWKVTWEVVWRDFPSEFR